MLRMAVFHTWETAMSKDAFRPGEIVRALHPEDGSWYKVRIEQLEGVHYIVSIPDRPDNNLRTYARDPVRRRFLVCVENIRRL